MQMAAWSSSSVQLQLPTAYYRYESQADIKTFAKEYRWQSIDGNQKPIGDM